MRVCEVIESLDPGAVATLLVKRLSRAPRDDVRYTVVCLRAGGQAGRLRGAGIRVVDLSRPPGPLRHLCLAAAVWRSAPDVVNVHSPGPAVLVRLLARLPGRRPRLVRTVHSAAYRPVTRLLDRITRRFDDRTVAVSPIVAGSRTLRGVPHVLVRVHGVDVREQRRRASQAARVRHGLGVPPEAFLLVCAADLRPVKDPCLLVEAAAQVLRRRPDALFLLAGDGPLRRRVEHEVRVRGLAGRVRLLGRVPEAGRLIAAADLLVLSSRYETLPVTVMEALAAGVPVVAPAVGGLPGLVESGRNGILTAPGRADALAAAIVRAMDPGVHTLLRAGAAATPVTDIAETAEWFDRLYHDLAGRPRATRATTVAGPIADAGTPLAAGTAVIGDIGHARARVSGATADVPGDGAAAQAPGPQAPGGPGHDGPGHDGPGHDGPGHDGRGHDGPGPREDARTGDDRTAVIGYPAER